MKRLFLLSLLILYVSSMYAKDYRLTSPDGNVVVTIKTEPSVSWSATINNKLVIKEVSVGMTLDNGVVFGNAEVVRKATTATINDIIEPVVAHKRSRITDNCNTLLLTFKSGFALNFRAYNDGVAYRFESSFKNPIVVINEKSDISFPEGSHSWFPYEDSFMSHNERAFVYSSLDTVSDKYLASLPALFTPDDVNVLITEAHIENYPGMWLRGAGNSKLSAVWPQYPKQEKLNSDRNLAVTEREDYIAKSDGTRTFPWRAFIITESDGGLIESDMVFKLAAPNRLAETDWIKPGKVAWDWWNYNNIYGVDFKAGVNTETYKYYIDFAAENGIEYIILDEGWYKLGNVLDISPEVDVKEICRYGNEKNVGVILWVVWKTFHDNMEEAFKEFSSWGAKGVKVDFMQRDDQKMVDFYYECAEMAAKYKMLVDYHGCYKPDGLRRTYPNVITREGVKGLENSKWSTEITPAHDIIIAFTRMVAGPMDYTPGAMVNYERNYFRAMNNRPASQGTRAHQMALYVVYESPLQMLADNPSNYKREQECTDFISKVPVVWDDVKVLEGKIGNYLLVARRSGDDWYVGGLTDWSARSFEIDLSFLGTGTFVMDSFADGINANRFAQDYKHSSQQVRAGETVKINLASGGGWVAKFKKQ